MPFGYAGRSAMRAARLRQIRALVIVPTVLTTAAVLLAPLASRPDTGQDESLGFFELVPPGYLAIVALLSLAIPGQLILCLGSGLWRVVAATFMVGIPVLVASLYVSLLMSLAGAPVVLACFGAHIAAAIVGFVAAIVVRDEVKRRSAPSRRDSGDFRPPDAARES